MFSDKILLITGGTGSFGQTLVDRFLETDVGEIRIFSRDEKKQEDMRINLQSDKLMFYLGDVRDRRSISNAMKGFDFVFHAAALKQVPSCEFYPMEAVATNILGTENVLEIAAENGVKKAILLSTDKAVYPINAMGLSKAMAEKVMLSRSRSQSPGETIFCATRYGNVMASRGSVIPLFVEQIMAKKPLTITDPNMTRFLMSLDESVDLVLHAYKNGEQGDVFVQKAPAVTIGDLATALEEILGGESGIRVIGTRHGEKLYESLISREEMIRASDNGKYFRISADIRDLNYAKYFNQGDIKLSQFEDYTSHNTTRLTVAQTKEKLTDLDYIKGYIDA